MPLDLLWDRRRFLATLWSSAKGVLRGFLLLIYIGTGSHCSLLVLTLEGISEGSSAIFFFSCFSDGGSLILLSLYFSSFLMNSFSIRKY